MKKIFFLFLFIAQLCVGRTANDVYRMPSSGNVPGWGTIAKAALPALSPQTSGCIDFTTSSNSPVDVTGMTISITTIGHPVLCVLQGCSTGNPAYNIGTTSSAAAKGNVFLNRDGSNIVSAVFSVSVGGATIVGGAIPSSSISYLDTAVTAGAHTYKIQTAAGVSATVSFEKTALYCFEF